MHTHAERERETETERQTEIERHTNRDRHRGRQRNAHTEIETEHLTHMGWFGGKY